MKYAAIVTFEYGSKEELLFPSVEARTAYLDKNEECIESATLYTRSKKQSVFSHCNFPSIGSMTNYEMDVLL